MKKLIRDVVVNVIANLIAAAIVYLLGVVAGLFPSTAAAVRMAIAIVMVACFVVLQGTNWVESKLDPREPAYRKSLKVNTVAGVIAGVGFIVTFIFVIPELDAIPKLLDIIMRVMGVIAGVGMMFFFPALASEKRRKVDSFRESEDI